MRLFFAIWPPVVVARQLAGIAAEQAERGGGRATRAETIHLTLLFLGEVPEERLRALIHAAGMVQSAAFELCVDRLGYWRHNRLSWAGCTQVPPELPALAEALREVARKLGIPFADEPREFMPHLTLRRKAPADTAAEGESIVPLRWQCSSFALVHSQAVDGASVYETLWDFPLRP